MKQLAVHRHGEGDGARCWEGAVQGSRQSRLSLRAAEHVLALSRVFRNTPRARTTLIRVVMGHERRGRELDLSETFCVILITEQYECVTTVA